MPSAGFEPAIPTVKLLQTYSLGRTAPVISRYYTYIGTSQYCNAIKNTYLFKYIVIFVALKRKDMIPQTCSSTCCPC